jgi:uncharacterized protein (DUF1330 family)
MPVHMIARMTIHDRAQYDKFSRKWTAMRSVLTRFLSKPQLFAWLMSPEYQEIGKGLEDVT